MTELPHDSVSSVDALAFFREHREQLGNITYATMTRPRVDVDARCTLVIGDNHGRRMLLSAMAGPDTGDAAMQVLVEAGFAAEIAEAVRSHEVVRLTRTREGTTFLEQATGLVNADHGSRCMTVPEPSVSMTGGPTGWVAR